MVVEDHPLYCGTGGGGVAADAGFAADQTFVRQMSWEVVGSWS